jgi:hypothetical protein
MFDPTKITTFIGLAAAAIWAICYVSNRRRSVVLATLVVALAALGTAAALELTQHVDVCATVHGLRLNEVCAEGKDCEPGKDFIEVVNPNATPIGLSCYAIGDQRSARDGQTRVDRRPVLLDGELAPGAIRAWDEDQLGFRISWQTRDRVVLFKLKLQPGKNVAFVPLEKEHVLIDESATYWSRTPDGSGELRSVSHQEIKASQKKIGSFGRSNGK